LTLVILADRQVRNESTSRLALLARSVGIKDFYLGTRPKVVPVARTP